MIHTSSSVFVGGALLPSGPFPSSSGFSTFSGDEDGTFPMLSSIDIRSCLVGRGQASSPSGIINGLLIILSSRTPSAYVFFVKKKRMERGGERERERERESDIGKRGEEEKGKKEKQQQQG